MKNLNYTKLKIIKSSAKTLNVCVAPMVFSWQTTETDTLVVNAVTPSGKAKKVKIILE
jgi:hypothetical protein